MIWKLDKKLFDLVFGNILVNDLTLKKKNPAMILKQKKELCLTDLRSFLMLKWKDFKEYMECLQNSLSFKPRTASQIKRMLINTPSQNCHFFMRRIVS